jgi:hypothetical protein
MDAHRRSRGVGGSVKHGSKRRSVCASTNSAARRAIAPSLRSVNAARAKARAVRTFAHVRRRHVGTVDRSLPIHAGRETPKEFRVITYRGELAALACTAHCARAKESAELNSDVWPLAFVAVAVK